jgi:hypothetical protein
VLPPTGGLGANQIVWKLSALGYCTWYPHHTPLVYYLLRGPFPSVSRPAGIAFSLLRRDSPTRRRESPSSIVLDHGAPPRYWPGRSSSTRFLAAWKINASRGRDDLTPDSDELRALAPSPPQRPAEPMTQSGPPRGSTYPHWHSQRHSIAPSAFLRRPSKLCVPSAQPPPFRAPDQRARRRARARELRSKARQVSPNMHACDRGVRLARACASEYRWRVQGRPQTRGSAAQGSLGICTSRRRRRAARCRRCADRSTFAARHAAAAAAAGTPHGGDSPRCVQCVGRTAPKTRTPLARGSLHAIQARARARASVRACNDPCTLMHATCDSVHACVRGCRTVVADKP